MPDRVLLEEFHLTFTVLLRTPDHVREAARRAINSRQLQRTLRRAIHQALATHPAPCRFACPRRRDRRRLRLPSANGRGWQFRAERRRGNSFAPPFLIHPPAAPGSGVLVVPSSDCTMNVRMGTIPGVPSGNGRARDRRAAKSLVVSDLPRLESPSRRVSLPCGMKPAKARPRARPESRSAFASQVWTDVEQ